jgi:hypothetical protein
MPIADLVDELATVPTIELRWTWGMGSLCVADQGDLRSRKANVEATALLRLSGASLVSVVESPHLRNRNDVALFRLLDRSGLRGVFAQG